MLYNAQWEAWVAVAETQLFIGAYDRNLRREMSKQRERYVLNLDQNIQKGINRVKSQFFEAASDGKLTFKTCLKQFLSKNKEKTI